MRTSRAILAAIPTALLLLLSSACSSPEEGTEVAVSEPDDPSTGEDDPDEETGDPDDPSVSLPTLPIGGGSSPLEDPPDVVCADVSWLWPSGDPSLPDGVSIRVTGYVVDPAVFEPVDVDCDAPPCLDGFVFTAEQLDCRVAMRSLVPATDDQDGEDAVLRLEGVMTCPSDPCELDEEATEGDTEVTLNAPYVPGSTDDPIEEDTDTTDDTTDDDTTDDPTDDGATDDTTDGS